LQKPLGIEGFLLGRAPSEKAMKRNHMEGVHQEKVSGEQKPDRIEGSAQRAED
jgi:hypothetical protein